MLLSVFLPVFNFSLIVFFGRYVGKIGVIYITLYSILLALVLNVKIFYMVLANHTTYFIVLGTWINVGILNINWEFMYDILSVTLLVMVNIISIIVHTYSFSYIKTDPHFNRFISYLSLFTFFIFILVTASNFVQLFVGWEGVGICSYLLINFWFTRIQAGKAAIKAILMNRIGDIGLLIAIALIFAVFKTLDFNTIQTITPVIHDAIPAFALWSIGNSSFVITLLDAICFFLLVGVAGKSAQIGLHTWLPAAIEGPTPVSALIHAATMVTAGIFLLIRVSFLFECSLSIKIMAIVLGSITALLSAITAIFLYDIKKIIAYSTCSQLGYMLLACGLAQYSIGLFHLINHAFFKALLFLTAGAIIHSFNNEQDVRKLSGLFTRIPFIYAAILIGNVAIIGLPFLSGFYSKDLIIEMTYLGAQGAFGIINVNIIFIFIMVATLCTAIYSLRLFYYLFLRHGTIRRSELKVTGLIQPFFIQLALGLLILGSIFSGYFLSDIFATTNNLFYNVNHVHTQDELGNEYTSDLVSSSIDATWSGTGINTATIYFENEFLPWSVKLAPLFCNLIVLLVSVLFIFHYNNGFFPHYVDIVLALISPVKEEIFKLKKSSAKFCLWLVYDFNKRAGYWLTIAQNNFYFNEIYNYIVLVNFHYYYQGIFLNLDKGLFELAGPTGISRIYFYIVRIFSYFYQQGLSKQLFLIYNTILTYFFLVEYFL